MADTLLEPGKNMMVFIKFITGKTIGLDVKSDQTIESLKAKIEDKEGIPPENQCLIFRDKKLQIGHTLYEYKVHKDAVIHLMIRSSSE